MGLPRVTSAIEYQQVGAIYLRPDENVSWQQIVETASSLRHMTELPVALDAAEPPTMHWLDM